VLQGGALLNLSLAFTAASGGASSDRSLDQDPSRYPIGTGSALGAGGGVYFTIDAAGGGGGHGTADPTAKCRKAQLTSGAKLCQSELKCLATYAKNSAKPDALLKSVACVTKAKNAFTSSYDKAAAAAAKKGLQCGTTDTAATLSGSLDARIGTVVSKVNDVDPEYLPLKSSWLGGAGTACGAGLRAEATNAAKPDAAKLAKARQKATDNLTSTANKAVDKAVKKGISFTTPPDVTGFVESVDSLIDDTSSDLNGD
jgi:hypothetical protein